MRGAIAPLPNTPSWRGAQLKKHRGKFTFTFIIKVMNFWVPLKAGNFFAS
jgi:hypothetical protein